MALTVLVVEDQRIVAMDLQHQLRALGYSAPATAASGSEALRLAEELRPDLVLMDVRIKGPMDGVMTAARLREQLDVPVIFVTAHADDATLARAKQSGTHGYLLKPVNPAELKSTIEIATFRHKNERELRASNAALAAEQKRSSVLLAQLIAAVENLTCGVAVTDSAGKIVVVNRQMLDIFRLALTVEEAIGQSAFGLILRNVELIEDQEYFHRRILEIADRRAPVYRDRVAFRDGRLYDRDFVPAVLGQDAVGHVWCYYDVTSAERQRELLVDRAQRDALTGIPNRCGLDIIIQRRIALGEPFALLFIDLNGFKAVNDTLGHDAGDAVLIEAAARLRKTLRGSDDVARLAGDEFVGIAVAVTDQVVRAVVAKVRDALTFETAASSLGVMPVSASVGYALFPDDGRDAALLMRKADEGMYAMKTMTRRSSEPDAAG
jgi:diguanylate cyclase (GGDEF)-like protein